MLDQLEAALPVDVVLLMLHGAMVAGGYDDCEQDILHRVRQIVGPDITIGVELDLHCHLTSATIADADLVILFKEYPHDDVAERAAELFELAIKTSEGKIAPVMALFDCHMVGLYPTTREPLKEFVASMSEAEKRPGVLSISFGHGFPFADVPGVGAKMLVITDDDPKLARNIAREFGLRVHQMRTEIGFDSISVPMDEALSRALQAKSGPVVLADQSDNVGGGAGGDSTFVLQWLLEHGATRVGLAILYDPEVVKAAKKIGRGSTSSFRLGGKFGPGSGMPIDVEAEVLNTADRYVHEFPQKSGDPWPMPAGDVVALRLAGEIDVIVSSERCQCFCPSIFIDLGIDPTKKKALVAKSYQHFAGGFAPIASDIIYMATPGALPPDPRDIPYTRLDTQDLYPWVAAPMR